MEQKTRLEEVSHLYDICKQYASDNKTWFTKEAISAFREWYNKASLLFANSIISSKNKHYLNEFDSVDISGNGYLLYQSFIKIEASYNILINEIIELVNSKGYNKMTQDKEIKVFIVHGHGDKKDKVARMVEKLGFKAIILQEQFNQGDTIIEKLERCTKVDYAIVIYTGCDRGAENKANVVPKPRARQNVVFEHGYLIAKLGRDNVCMLVEPDVEKPSDCNGLVFIALDENDGWQKKLAEEMKRRNLPVDLNKLS